MPKSSSIKSNISGVNLTGGGGGGASISSTGVGGGGSGAADGTSRGTKPKRNKLNSILNRTLSDSILDKKSHNYAIYSNNNNSNTPHSRRDPCLSRKNSTNRRSIIHHANGTTVLGPNTNALLFPHHSSTNFLNKINTSNNGGGGGAVTSLQPSSPSLLSAPSPNPLFLNSHQSSNILNYRNKLRHHRSSCCVLNNNVPGQLMQQLSAVNLDSAAQHHQHQHQHIHHHHNHQHHNNQHQNITDFPSSFSSSLSSSLSPSPITISNHQHYLLSTPPSNSNFSIQNNYMTRSAVPTLSSPKFQLTPAASFTHRVLLPNASQNQSNLLLLASNKNIDTRRWSFASIHSTSSSGYGGGGGVGGTNTPPILTSLPASMQQPMSGNGKQVSCSSSTNILTDNMSNQSSLYSSNEKIAKSQSTQSQHSQSSCKLPGEHANTHQLIGGECKHEQNPHQHPHQIAQRLSLCERRSRMSSSNDSSQLDDSSEAGFSSPIPFNRQRARSLSCSPTKDQNESDIVLLQNERFKEIFPRACKQMEESLSKFIEANKIDLTTSSVNDASTTSGSGVGGAGGGGGGGETDNPVNVNADHRHHHQILKHQMSSTLHALDPAARFIHSQVLEIAKLCLEKSKSNQLTCSYFDETISSLEKLLLEACDKCSQVQQSLDYLQKFIKKFLLIVSRVARLLECIEFDPLEFCYMLEFAEQQAKQESISIDIPKYIISKLGFDRADPLEELHRQTDDGDYDELTAHDDDATNMNINTNNVKRNSDVGTASLAYKSSADSKGLNTNSGALNGSSATGGGQSSDDLVNTNNINSPIVKSEVNTPVVAPPCEDDFEEIKLISNGAYGAVYLVRHKLIGERFAMKKIKKHNLVLRNQLQQVFTERDIMTFTDNPFVVALVCTFETKKHLCMVMEYVEGGDVATLIKNMGPLPLDMARTYFAEATLAVEYLHNYGIIHRDLKPDNLLITSLGHIKLTDFGLSKIGLMNLTTNFYEGDSFMRDHYCKEFNDKQICGTPQYLAPEVILRQCYGKTVDWWSMGIILYEFLTSVAPFNGNTPEELFSNVINGELLWPDDNDELVHIPDDAKQLIIGLLAHDPLKRLGANGAAEIKQHLFFINLDWNNLLRTKAEFIPQLDGPDDTSYFDTRSERYNHDSDSSISVQSNTAHGTALGSSSFPVAQEPTGSKAESLLSLNQNDDTQSKLADLMKHNFNLNQTSSNNNNNDDMLINDETDNELFASFSSCSSRFRLNSISTNNSPVLFMNESNLNLSPSTHHLSDVKSSSNPTTGNKLSKTLFLPIDPIKLEPVVNPDVSVTKPVKANDDDNEPKTSPDDEEIKTNKVKDSQSSTCSSTSTNTTIDPNRTKTDLEPTADSSATAPSTSLTKSSSCTVPVAVAKPATPTTPTTPSFNNSNNNGNVNKSSKSLQAKQQYHKPGGYGAQTGGNNSNGRRSSNKNSPTCDVPYYNGANNNSNQRARNYSINDYHIPSGGHHQGMQQPQQHAYGGRNQAVNYGGGSAGTSKLNRWSSALASSTSAGSSAAAAAPMSKTVANNIEDYVAAHNHASLSKSNLNLTSNQTFEHPNNVYRKQTSMNEYENAAGSVHSNQSPSSSRQNLLSIQNNNNTNQSNSKHHSNNQKKLHEIIQMGLSRPKVTIKRGYRGFGFTIGAIKVFTDDSDQYSIHHLVIQVDPDGAANSAGLKVNDIITHVNDEVVCGRAHHEIIRLIMSNNTLSLNTVQLSQTNIKKGQHRRTTAKSKFSKPSSTSSGLQKTPSHHHNPQHYHHYHHHYHHYNQHNHNNNPHNYHYSSHGNNNNNNNSNNHQSVNSANNGGVKNPGRQYKSFGGNNSNSNSNQSLSNYYFIKPSQNAQNELLFYNQMSNFLSSNPSTTHSSTSSLLSSASASSRQSIGPFVDYNQANQVYLAHHLHPPGSYSHMSQPFGPLVQQTSSSSSTSSQTATAPGVVQHMQPEKKKKTTLFRKLSEKRAHKYEFMQQQQQQQQQQQFNYQQQQLQQLHQQQQLQAMQNNNPKHSSSSSSSSSSLNSSFNNNNNNNNNHNAHTGRLNSVGNLSPKLVPNYYQNFTNNSFTNATEVANNSANARRNMSTNDLRLFFTSSSEEATTNNNNNLATGSSQTSGNSNPNSDSSNSPSAPNSPACSKQQLTLNNNANVFSAALLNASTLTESANVANQSIKTGSLTSSNEPTTELAVKKPDDVQENDKNNNNDDDGTNLDSTEHDNYNTITAASSSNTGGSSFFSGSKLIQNLFNSNHHFQSINHQSDSQSNESTPTNKSQAIVAPSFTNLTDSQTNQSKSANSKSGTQPPPPPPQQQQQQSTGSSQKSTKTSFISSIKSTIQQPLYNLSNRNNATKIASPFSAIKNNIITNNNNSKNHQQAANSTKQSKQTPAAVAVSQNPTPVINNDSELPVGATTDSSQIDSTTTTTTTNSTNCVDHHHHHHQTDQKNETSSSSLANNDDEPRTN